MDFAVTTLEIVAVLGAVFVAALVGVLGALAVATWALLRRAARRAPALGDTIVIDGVPLHYVERGAGRPVVYLHGAGGSVYDVLLSVGPRLAQDYRLIAFDRPGCGHSGRPAGLAGSPAVQARLLWKALQELGVTQPLIVAHSAGAPVAMTLALDHPGEIAAVVTLGGYLFSVRDPDRVLGKLLTAPILGRLLLATVVVPLGTLVSRFAMNRLFFPDPVDPAFARVAPALVLRPGRQAVAAHDVADLEDGLRELAGRYADLAVPVVAVHGLADYIVSAAHAVRLSQLAPDTELVLLEETGHLPHFTRPQAVIEAVDTAWRRAYTPRSAALGGEPAVPCTRNPLQRG